MPILYCRHCDLGFCDKHLDEHDGDDHELMPDHRVEFCCVCAGIYAPRTKGATA